LRQKKQKMKKYSYEISIEAASEKEADTKMKALSVLAKKLSAKELEKLADIIQNDPQKTALAKQALGV
jgi:hypothetical protein